MLGNVLDNLTQGLERPTPEDIERANREIDTAGIHVSRNPKICELQVRCWAYRYVVRREHEKNPPPRPVHVVSETPPKPTPFERDIANNRKILGGASEALEGASIHNPNLIDTKAFAWLTGEFEASGQNMPVLFGGTGSGKTWAMLAYVNNLAYDEKADRYGRVKLLMAYELSTMLMNFKGNDDELEDLVGVPYLILDDLGTEPPGFRGADFSSHFCFLIERRHRFGKFTGMTCNGTLESFSSLYDERVISRLRDRGLWFVTNDEDLRGGQ